MIVSVTCGTASPMLHLPPPKDGCSLIVRRATKRETDAVKRHRSFRRQRAEAPWNFTKNPLGVTKALTIPWEFINKTKNISRQKNRL